MPRGVLGVLARTKFTANRFFAMPFPAPKFASADSTALLARDENAFDISGFSILVSFFNTFVKRISKKRNINS
jgi:hypothetical protein